MNNQLRTLTGFAMPVIIVLMCFFANPIHSQTGKNPQSDENLKKVTLPAKPQQRLEALLSLSEFNPDVRETIRFSEEAIYLADSLNNKPFQIKALIINARGWKKWGDPAHALEKLGKAYTLARETKDQRALAEIYTDLGETHRAALNKKEALKFLYQAQTIANQLQDSLLIARIHDRLAAVWFEKLHELPEMTQDRITQRFLNPALQETLFSIPEVKEITDSLLFHLNYSGSLANILRDADLMISNKIIRAAYLNSVGDFHSAVQIYQHLYDSLNMQANYPHFELILINYGTLLRLMNDYPGAMKYLEEARDLALSHNNLIYSRMAFQVLAQLYYDVGDYKKAAEALDSYADILLKMYQAYVQLKEFQSLQTYKAAQLEQKIKTQKTALVSAIIFFLLILIILSIFLWLLSKQVKKQKALLAELHQKNEELIKNDQEKDKFFSIIAHDLKTPFNAIMGFSNLLLDEIREKGYFELGEYARIVKESSENAYSLLVNLLEWSRARTGQLKFLPEKINFPEILKEIEKTFLSQSSRKNISIVREVPDNLTLTADPVMLHAILRNLLSNCIKFTNPGGKILVRAEKSNGMVEIIISDTGIGMNQEQLDSLFDLSKTHSRKGTQNETGTGLGLLMTKEFVEKHGGILTIESKVGEGTTYKIQFKEYLS